MGERRDVYRGLLEEKRLLENKGADDKMILSWIFGNIKAERHVPALLPVKDSQYA